MSATIMAIGSAIFGFGYLDDILLKQSISMGIKKDNVLPDPF